MSDADPAPLARGRYQLLDVLGAGGMATVYRAHDTRLDVHRAVKILKPELAARASLRARFENEARTMARLQHRNIVTVHDVDHDGDRVFMVMELVPGRSLVDWMEAQGRLTADQACGILDQVLDAMALAHERGVIHRDLKPHNVLISKDGVPRVTDFGIARINEDGGDLTRTGAVMGTWAYMAPEQRVDAKSVDARADVYALGATLFALVTGREPFDLYTTEIHDRLFVGVSEPLAAVIKKACRYDREERYASAREMQEALRTARAALVDGDVLPRASTAWRSGGDEVTADFVSEEHPAEPEQAAGPVRPWSGRGGSAAVSGGGLEVAAAETFDGASLAGATGLADGAVSTLNEEPAPPPPRDPPPPAPIASDPSPRNRYALPGLVGVALLAATALVAWIVPNGPTVEVEPPSAEVEEPAAHVASPPVPEEAEAEAEPAPADVQPTEEAVEQEPPSTPAPPPRKAAATRRDPPPAAPPVAEEPAAEPLPADARLLVNSRPASRVSLDGEEVGGSFRAYAVTGGTHRVRLSTADGRVHQTELTVGAGQELAYCWDFDMEATCSR